MRRAWIFAVLLVPSVLVAAVAATRTDAPAVSSSTTAGEPSDTAVLPPTPRVQALADSIGCRPDQDAFDCLDVAALESYRSDGAAGLVSTVTKWQQQVLPDGLPCHRLTHLIGKYAAEHLDLPSAVAESSRTTDLCANGFFHGIIEGTAYRFSGEVLASRLVQICTAIDRPQYNDCVHSSGHAMAMTEPDDVYSAIDLCGPFGSDASRCVAGVFMSFGRGTAGFESDGSQRWISYASNVPKDLCYKVVDEYVPHCWFLLWTAYESDPKLGGVDAYRQICPRPDDAPVEQQADPYRYCYRGLGMLLLERGEVSASDAAQLCPSDTYGGYWCTFGIGWAFMYDHALAFGSGEGFDTQCSTLRKEWIRACIAGEQYALVDGDNV